MTKASNTVIDYYDDEIDIFLTYLDDLGYSPFTISSYFLDVQQFLLFLNKDRDIFIDIDDVNKLNITEFLRRTQKGKSKSTRNRRLMALRTFYKALIKNDKVKINPAAEVDIAKTEKNSIPTYLNDEELHDLFNQIKNDQYYLRNKCILMLMALAGLRVIEIRNLNLIDIVRVNDNPGINVLGKGNKSRYIPLPIPLYELMLDYENFARPIANEESQEAFFISKRGTRISRRRIQEIAENTFKDLKAIQQRKYLVNKPLTAHKLRHSFGTRLVKQGVDLVTIQELMGHTNLNTTQIYTHIDDKQKQDAMRKNNTFDFFS